MDKVVTDSVPKVRTTHVCRTFRQFMLYRPFKYSFQECSVVGLHCFSIVKLKGDTNIHICN